MGAWGLGSFENDDALDWVIDLESTSDMTLISDTLSVVNESEEDYLDASDSSFPIVAAEVVAALGGKPADELPDEVVKWVQGKGEPGPDLVSGAKQAISAVLDSSELKELWEETDEFEIWVNDVESLLERLG